MRQYAGWLVAAACVVVAFTSSAISGPTTPAAVNGGVYNSTPPTLSDTQTGVFQLDANGQLKVAATATLTNPTIGAAVPATANYIAGNKGGLLAGVTLDASGYLNVNCAAGCTGGNANGQATMANSAPVVIASDQTAVAIKAASASIASGAIASGAVASGAVASGAYAAGALALGSIADGADVTQGAKADAKSTATDTTAITIMSVLKEISFMEQTPASRAVTNTGTFVTQSAITAASGSIGSGAVASGAIASGAVASGAIASGAYASGSVSDGAVVTLGAKADARATQTDTTAITIMQVLKEISFMAQTPAALPANQSSNVAQINGVTPLMGTGNTGTGSIRVTIATDQAQLTNKLLVTPDANSAVNVSQINGVTPLMGNGTTGTGSPRVTIASDNTTLTNTFGNVGVVPLTTGGLLSYVVEPGASDNHVVIKAGAGQVYGMYITTKHTAAQYVRLYNATTGFNGCNSATNLQFEGIVPAASTGAGFALPIPPGLTFATGISICFTGAYGNTDTTNATASVSTVNVFYK